MTRFIIDSNLSKIHTSLGGAWILFRAKVVLIGLRDG